MAAESSRQSSASTGPQHLQSHAAAKARRPPPRQSSSHQDQSGPHHPAHHGNLVPAPADSPDPIGMTTTTNGVAKDRGPVVATSPSDSTSRPTASSSSNARRRPSLLPLPEYYVVNGRESWISPRDMGYLRQLGSSTSPGKTNGHAQQGSKPPLRFKTLPAGYRLGRFVGEGAANAVFEVQLADGTCLRHEDGTRKWCFCPCPGFFFFCFFFPWRSRSCPSWRPFQSHESAWTWRPCRHWAVGPSVGSYPGRIGSCLGLIGSSLDWL